MAFSALEIYEMFVEESTRGEVSALDQLLEYISDITGNEGRIPKYKAIGFSVFVKSMQDGMTPNPVRYTCKRDGCNNPRVRDKSKTKFQCCSKECSKAHRKEYRRQMQKKRDYLVKYDRALARRMRKFLETYEVNND